MNPRLTPSRSKQGINKPQRPSADNLYPKFFTQEETHQSKHRCSTHRTPKKTGMGENQAINDKENHEKKASSAELVASKPKQEGYNVSYLVAKTLTKAFHEQLPDSNTEVEPPSPSTPLLKKN